MSSVTKSNYPSKTEIDELAARWNELKQAERELRDERWALEEALADRLGRVSEGALTAAGHVYTFQTRFRISRSLDENAWERIRDRVPADKQPVRWKAQLDTRRYLELARREPALAQVVGEAVEERVCKVSVSVSERNTANRARGFTATTARK